MVVRVSTVSIEMVMTMCIIFDAAVTGSIYEYLIFNFSIQQYIDKIINLISYHTPFAFCFHYALILSFEKHIHINIIIHLSNNLHNFSIMYLK